MNDLHKQSTFYLIPEKTLDELIEAVRNIKKFQEALENGEANARTISDYIDEEQAMKMLKRGKT